MMITGREEHISTLLLKCIVGTITEEEQRQLDDWRQESEAHEQLYSHLQDVHYLEKEYHRRKTINIQRPLADMEHRIKAEKSHKAFVGWKPWIAAASITLLFCISFAKFWVSPIEKEVANLAQTVAFADIKPGTQQATLTLTDGEKLQLGANEKANEYTIKQHQAVAQAIPDIKQLSLEVPRGGEFKIVLEDSTEVWLNSESKLIYPESFSETERRVIVMGEAYFKVTKDAERPFYVETDGQQVRVYGTEFNIRSYAEDKQVYTTLIEGSISLSKLTEESGELMLTPGHQVLFDKNEATTFVKKVNTAVITSWREGRFVFEDQNLEQIMQELSRWYDFDFRFEDENLKQIVFMGSIPRYGEFSTALALLKKSGGLKFSLQDSIVIIEKEN